MTGAALLRSVVAALDESGVPFMLTGSLAAAYHGAGRATLDVDLVIDPDPVQLRSLVQRLEGQGPMSPGTRPTRRSRFEGTRLHVATVEDVILSKLEWAKLGNSARQLEDVSALLRIHAGRLDAPYLERWVAALDVGTQWQAVNRGGAS